MLIQSHLSSDNSFRKSERLCAKKEFDTLFVSPRVSHSSLYKVMWKVSPNVLPGSIPSKIALSVPKRLFKRAVDRNVLKRRTREAYRTSKHHLLSTLDARGLQLRVLFVYTRKDIRQQPEISEHVNHLLCKIEHEIITNYPLAHADNMASKDGSTGSH